MKKIWPFKEMIILCVIFSGILFSLAIEQNTYNAKASDTNCDTIVTVDTDVTEFHPDTKFHCLVHIDPIQQNDIDNIGCGLQVNGEWPEDICPVKSSRDYSWNHTTDILTFTSCDLSNYHQPIDPNATYSMLAFDFAQNCGGPENGQSKHITINPTLNLTPSPLSIQSSSLSHCRDLQLNGSYEEKLDILFLPHRYAKLDEFLADTRLVVSQLILSTKLISFARWNF